MNGLIKGARGGDFVILQTKRINAGALFRKLIAHQQDA